MNLHRFLAVIAVVLMLAPPVSAQTADPLATVREHVLYARYPEAITAANEILARTDLTAEARNGALELLATAQLANREVAGARRTLETLYARDPGHRLSDPDASPPVVSAFARARESAPSPVMVELRHRTPIVEVRESPNLECALGANADAVAQVWLVFQQGSEGWSRVAMNRRPNGSFGARIPTVGAPTEPVDVAYYIEALAPSGAVLAHRGSEADALSLRIPAEAPAIAAGPTQPVDARGGNVTDEWWFWTLLGVVVVGGATAGVWLAVEEGNRVPDGTLGTVVLRR